MGVVTHQIDSQIRTQRQKSGQITQNPHFDLWTRAVGGFLGQNDHTRIKNSSILMYHMWGLPFKKLRGVVIHPDGCGFESFKDKLVRYWNFP